jgi:hypothetical protein
LLTFRRPPGCPRRRQFRELWESRSEGNEGRGRVSGRIAHFSATAGVPRQE